MTPRDDHSSWSHLSGTSATRSLPWHGHLAAADTTAEGRTITAPLHSPHQAQQPYMPQWLRAVDDHPPLLDPHRLSATLHYLTHPWYRVPKALLLLGTRGIRGCWYECTYCLAGAGKVADAIYSFTAALDHERAAKLALGTTHQYRGAERHVNAKTWRRRIIGIGIATLAILGLWLGLYHPSAGALAGIGVAAVLDAVGRHGRTPREKPARKPQALHPGTPSTIIWGQISAFIAEQELDHAVQVYAVRPDPWREAFQVDVHTQIEIDPKLLRALEKRIYVRHGACRLATCPTNAADKTITIQLTNPLRAVPQAPWLPAGSVSGWQPLDLGASSDRDHPFEIVLVMQHIMLISRTRGGKTTHISNIIDRLSACRDVIVAGGALVKSAVFDSWRSVLHKKAETIAELEELLLWALDEIARRDRILKDINSDDDPDNDVDKWNPSLGHAIVLVIDEWSEASEYDGTKLAGKDYKPDILGLMKRITRTGAGLGVSAILSVQASGNQDWGSSVLNKQTNIKIMGPCTEDDTVAVLGKDKRDQGYAPHALKPADENNPNDAGMAVIDGPGFGADYVRGYAPFPVKARAIRREKEWAQLGNRPQLPAESPVPVMVIDAVQMPRALAAIEAALNHHQVDVLSSALVIKHANDTGGHWTQTTLSAALKKEVPGNGKSSIIGPRNGRCGISCSPEQRCRCYYREDVDNALKILSEA